MISSFRSIIYCVALVMAFENAEALEPDKPVVEIIASSDYQITETSVIKLTKTPTMLVIPQNAKFVKLSCIASYPVAWNIDDQAEASNVYGIGFRTKRVAKDVFDSSTFEYSSELTFYPTTDSSRTGNYSCRSVAYEHLQVTRYLFWEGPTALIHAYKNLTVFVDDDVVIIPCVVGKLKVWPPTLQKKNGTAYIDVNLSKEVSYSSVRGFVLTNPSTFSGQYKCIIKGEKDWMNVEVKFYNESFILPTKNSNATFTYDAQSKSLVCCSNSRRSPKLINYYCQHPTTCNFKSLFTRPAAYQFSIHKKVRRGCSKVKFHAPYSGIAHCRGDGIDMVKQYTFPAKYTRLWTLPKNDTLPIYFNWNEIFPQEMMVVDYDHIPSQKPTYYYYYMISDVSQAQTILYEGENIKFTCEPSAYYFAEGIHWLIKWKNSTVQLFNNSQSEVGLYYYAPTQESIVVKLHLDMESIICMAPVWNSTEYVFKPIPVYVNASKPAIIMDTEIEESLTWIMNDTNKAVSCTFAGIPLPTLSWKKIDTKNQTLDIVPGINNLNLTRVINNMTTVVSETLTIHRVSHDTAGVYICTASNPVATVSRKVTIEVEEPTSWKRTTAEIVGIILTLTLISGLGFLFWKFVTNKKVIKQESASAVGFKNTANREAIVTDVENTDFDAPKLQSNLLN